MSSVSSPHATQPTLLDAEPDRFSIWGWKNLTIVVWKDQPTRAAILRLQVVAERRAKLLPGGLSDVHLVIGRIGFPDSDTRDALVRVSKQAVPHLAAVGVVVGGSGFWGSTMRSLITSVRVLVPGPFEMGLFGTIDELVQWLPGVHAKRTGQQLDSALLKQALDHVVHASPAPGRQSARASVT